MIKSGLLGRAALHPRPVAPRQHARQAIAGPRRCPRGPQDRHQRRQGRRPEAGQAARRAGSKRLKEARGKEIELWQKRVAQLEAQFRDKDARRRQVPATSTKVVKDASGKVAVRGPAAGRADPLADLATDRRRADGRAGEPPARRRQHLHRRDSHGGKKQHPLSVSAVANRNLFELDPRDRGPPLLRPRVPRPGLRRQGPVRAAAEDRAWPIPRSNGNGFGGYGEMVFGTKGTLIIEREKESMLFTRPTRRARSRSRRARAGRRWTRRPAGRGRPRRGPGRGRDRPRRQPRLPRGAGALGLVHPQPRSQQPAPLPPRGRPGRRRDRPDHEHRRAQGPADQLQGRMVRPQPPRNPRSRRGNQQERLIRSRRCGSRH